MGVKMATALKNQLNVAPSLAQVIIFCNLIDAADSKRSGNYR